MSNTISVEMTYCPELDALRIKIDTGELTDAVLTGEHIDELTTLTDDDNPESQPLRKHVEQAKKKPHKTVKCMVPVSHLPNMFVKRPVLKLVPLAG